MFARLSTRLLCLILIPMIALVVLSIVINFRTNNQMIEYQAEKMATVISKQVLTTRKHYAKSVVSKVKGTDFGAKENYTEESGHVPLPATFVIGIADELNSKQDEFQYGLVSRWNINPKNDLSDPFLQRAYENLEAQEREAKSSGELSSSKAFTGWEPYSEVLDVDGREVYRYLAADTGVAGGCVSCHNVLEKRDDIIQLRNAANSTTGKQFALNDLMGAVAVEIDLEEVGAMASAGAVTSSLAMIFAGVVATGLAVLLIRRSFSSPMQALSDRMRDVVEGDGDLTMRIDEVGATEFRTLAHWFNSFVNMVHEVIQNVVQNTTEVAGAATEIAASSEEMAQSLEIQRSEIEQLTASISEMATTTRDIACQSEQANHNAKQTGDAATEGSTLVQDAIGSIHSLDKTVSQSADDIESLGTKSEEIGKIIGVINDIADQTNLLALNAAIEAARAGEHGRGFAVVADEVRVLADRTTKATDEIAHSIGEIQDETKQAVDRMSSGKDEAQSSVTSVEQAGNSLQAIVANATEVASLIGSIAAASEEQTCTADEMNASITKTSGGIQETTQGAVQSAEASSQLSLKSEDLRRIVERFKI